MYGDWVSVWEVVKRIPILGTPIEVYRLTTESLIIENDYPNTRVTEIRLAKVDEVYVEATQWQRLRRRGDVIVEYEGKDGGGQLIKLYDVFDAAWFAEKIRYLSARRKEETYGKGQT